MKKQFFITSIIGLFIICPLWGGTKYVTTAGAGLKNKNKFINNTY